MPLITGAEMAEQAADTAEATGNRATAQIIHTPEQHR
jgi:hypothetical protein